MEIFSTKAVLCFQGGHEIISVLLAFTVQFFARDLHTKLLSICEFLGSWHGKGCALLMHVSKIKLRVYRKSVWNFESKERLGIVRVQRHEMHHLYYLVMLSYVVCICVKCEVLALEESLYTLVTRNCCSILNHRLTQKNGTSEGTLL